MDISFLESFKKTPQLGIGIMYPASGIIERIGPDWDWIWIDGQHGQLDYSDILAAVRACNLIKRPCVVRVPGQESGAIGKSLDCSPDALMVPMINTAAQARKAVENTKFPPLGLRSYGGRRPIDMHGRTYNENQPALICQIETLQALDNCDEIASVDGVDMLFYGPDDMAMQHGLPMDQPKPEELFKEALKKVADCAAKYNKLAGIVAVDLQSYEKAVDLGYSLIVGSADVALLANGSKKQVEYFRTASKKDSDSKNIY